MKRILILCGILLLPAVVGVSSLQETEDAGIPPARVSTQDTSVIVRRVYEGPSPDFWGTCPSPDGRYVTQTDWDTGDLAVLDLLTGQKRRVTDKGDDGWTKSYAYSEAACFSPDGQRIAYVWFTEPGIYTLRVINTDGTNSRVIAESERDPENPSQTSGWSWWPNLHGWSPDGEHILVSLWYGRESGRGRETTLLSVADGSREVLYVSEDIEGAALSPDGRYLAYEERRDVFVRPVSGGDGVIVASGPSTDGLVGWTEEGNLLYVSDRDLTEGVWKVPMADGQASGNAGLVAGDLWGMNPIGVAGNSLFYGIDTQYGRVNLVSLDLTRNRVLGTPMPVEPEMRGSHSPAWSPDGQNLLFVLGNPPEARLMLRSTAGGETQDVTPPSLTWYGHMWSNDGRRILILGGGPKIEPPGFFAYTLATGEIELLFSPSSYEMASDRGVKDRAVHFSSDLRTVYLPISEGSNGPFLLLRRDIETGDEKTLLSRPARRQADVPPPFEEVFPSPDDRYLAFWELTGPDTARMLRVISSGGGDPRTLLTERWSEGDFPACPGRDDPLWTSDGRHLLTILRDSVPESRPFPPNPCKLYKVSVEGRDPIFVGAIPERNNFSAWALSPDDRRLAYTTGKARGEIWILQGLEGQ